MDRPRRQIQLQKLTFEWPRESDYLSVQKSEAFSPNFGKIFKMTVLRDYWELRAQKKTGGRSECVLSFSGVFVIQNSNWWDWIFKITDWPD